METYINPADITHPITPGISLTIKATISSTYTCSADSSQAKLCPQITFSTFLFFPQSIIHICYFLCLFYFYLLLLLHQVVPSSSPQFTSLPAKITKLSQAVHYFKFTACPFGLPRGGIKSGFGWRGDLGPNPNPSSYPFIV